MSRWRAEMVEAALRDHVAHAGFAGLERPACAHRDRAARHRAATALAERSLPAMHWLACGKTDTEIAALLSISPRTVQKYLEHIYVKLGVETRTAAVMRALEISERAVLREPLHCSNDDIARSPAASKNLYKKGL